VIHNSSKPMTLDKTSGSRPDTRQNVKYCTTEN